MIFNAGCRFFCNPVAGFAIKGNRIRLIAYRHSARFLPQLPGTSILPFRARRV
jgi:hypothetical protein